MLIKVIIKQRLYENKCSKVIRKVAVIKYNRMLNMKLLKYV